MAGRMAFAHSASGVAFSDSVPNWPEDSDIDAEIHPGPGRTGSGNEVTAVTPARSRADKDA